MGGKVKKSMANSNSNKLNNNNKLNLSKRNKSAPAKHTPSTKNKNCFSNARSGNGSGSDGGSGHDDDDDDEDEDLGFLMAENKKDKKKSADGDDSDDDSIEDLEDYDDFSDDEDNKDINDDDNKEMDDQEDSDHQQVSSDKKKSSTKRRDEINLHKKQLQDAMAKDPEFFKFLKENDADLLNFGEDDDDEEEEEDDDDDVSNGNEDMDDENGDGEEMEEDDLEKMMGDNGSSDEEEEVLEGEEDERENPNGEQTIVTKDMVAAWKKTLAESHSLRSAKKLLLAFKAAIFEGETESEEQEILAYKIYENSVLNSVVVSSVKLVVPTFNHHLPLKEGKSKKHLPSSSPKWRKIAPLVKSFLKTLLKALQQMSDESMLRFIMRETESSAPYFACFPQLAKEYLKQLLKLWISTTPETRIIAFLSIRRLALASPNPHLDQVIKGTYQTFASASRTTNMHTWSSIQFMMGCIIELAGMDAATGYHFGFVYLRQLAILLRNAITTKTKESFKSVYNWQFVHCIRLWSKVLCTYCESGSAAESEAGKTLQPLIYPLVQITLGAMRLKPSSKYFPLRFQCARILIELSRKTGTFIPIAPHLFEIFESSELKSKSKPSTLKPMDFNLAIKTPNQYLGTRVYQHGVAEEVISMLMDAYDCSALSISFPELATPAILQFKKYIKKSKNVVVNKHIQQLVEVLDQNSKFIEQHRGRIDFSPRDTEKVAAFLGHVDPMTSPLRKHATARRKMRENQMAEMQAHAAKVSSTQGSNAGKKNKRQGHDESDEEDEEDEVSDFVASDDDDEEEEEEMEQDEMEEEEEDEMEMD